MEVLSKYWIFMCAGMLLLIALQEVVIYRIIYLILFLLFVICFQVSYPLWRALMFAFWWLVIIYSMGVLIIIYTYQFEQFPSYWQNSTGWDNNTLADIGLEKFNGTELFIKLLTPTSFLIVIILQVHYFHTPFLRLSATDRFSREEEVESSQRYKHWLSSWAEAVSTEAETDDDIHDEHDPRLAEKQKSSFKLWLAESQVLVKMADVWDALTTFLWRLAEIHVFKLVVVIVMFVALHRDEVSAVTAVYVIFVMLLLPFVLTKAHLVLSNLLVIWTCIIILAKMLFQLRLVPESTPEICTSLNNTGRLEPKSGDDIIWLGFTKIGSEESIAYYIRLYILVLMVLLFESIVRYHQRQHFNHPDHPRLQEGIIFPNIHREHADRGIITCVKFFANYAFYKFGLEICYVTTAVTVCIRMDIFGVVYTVMLAVMMLFSRGTSARVWWLYMLLLAILLPIQYLGSLGFPPIACVVYPWHNLTYFESPLERWLYLPDPIESPPTGVLLGDVFQLLFVVLQWKVFRMEQGNRKQMCLGGDNNEILPEVEANMKIPVADFTLTTASYLDVCKQALFEYMFWVTLAVIFIAGATRINVFGLGYVIAVFLFMWYGKEFLLKPLRKLLRMWNFLIAYVVFVLFAKACLQLVGCVYISHLFANNCWLIQLFGINCLLPNKENIIEDALKEGCIIVEDNTGLTWDVVCFAFLLLQRRIYSCHYFRHIVDLLEAQSRLSSRGAELINCILLREVERQKEQESKILVNIKKKMHYLKERQAALRKDFKEPTEHFQAIRAGDYYLFEEGADEVLEKSPGEKVPSSITFGQPEEDDEEKRLGPLQGARVDAPEESKEPETTADKAKTWGNFFTTLVGSVVDWLIGLCNSISRNYRLVAQKLEGELRLEKDKIKSSHISRPPPSPVEMGCLEESGAQGSSSNPTFTEEAERNVEEEENERTLEPVVLERQASSSEENPDETVTDPTSLIEVTVEPVEPTPGGPTGPLSRLDSLDELELQASHLEQEFEKSRPRAYRLVEALVYVLISHSELLCYFLMILDQMVYGSLLSLPLPFMVFLWGMLSVPRPSKTFWITVITYTEAVVVTKYLFQFGFFPWNDGTVQESPFFPPRILGIEQKENYANVDIALLLALFIHRSILKKYGLWKDSKDISEDMAKAGMHEISGDTSGGLEDTTDDLEESKDKRDGPEKEPSRIKKSFNSAVAPFVEFFKDMACSKYSATVDSYAPMFCCDFINFFIVVFGYQSFGPAQESADGDVTSYISENRVPIPFLIMLLTQFVLIVIDRALFLRKNVMGKCIFQILLVILIHIWMFFVLPKVTSRSFFNNRSAQLWYFVKCVYFALSAYQIRCGYPTRILGNFLTKKYNYVNLFAFKGFLAVPFLLELRALMDWIWTDSTLAIGSWLQMEDIYANIFILKCWRQSESTYPTPRAQKKAPAIKYGVGGLLLFVIILIIWFPLVIFAFANTVFDPNPPAEVTIQIQLGAYQPLFKMTVQQNIENIPDSNFSALKDYFSRDQAAVSFLNRFETSDISVISFYGESTSIWAISEPAELEMVHELERHTNLKLEFSITIIRSSDSKSSDTLTTYFEANLDVQQLQDLARVINGTSNSTVEVQAVFPRFMQVNSKLGISPAGPLIEGKNGFGKTNLTLGLSGDTGVGNLNKYWSIREEIYGGSHFILVKDSKDYPASYTDTIKLVTFNDRKAPSTLSFLSGYGIIGLYVSFILLIGRFLRMAVTGQHLTIVFRELPMVDAVLQLCLDIYLVREMKEFHLEEDLYAKLIFLYRSPETIIKVTRPKPKTD